MPLVIRKEQMAALQLDFDIRWYVRQLAELYPDFAAAPAAQRHQWVREGIRRANAWELNRSEFFQFLCFEQTCSPGCVDLPSFDWARQILSDKSQGSADRMKRLRQRTIRRLLEVEAAQELAAEASAVDETVNQ